MFEKIGVWSLFWYSVFSNLSSFYNLDQEEKAGCSTLMEIFLPSYCWCSVVLHQCWSAVCDCGIFWPYSLFLSMPAKLSALEFSVIQTNKLSILHRGLIALATYHHRETIKLHYCEER